MDLANTNAVAKVSTRLIQRAIVPEAAIAQKGWIVSAMAIDGIVFASVFGGGVARDVPSCPAARAASESGFKGFREAGDGTGSGRWLPLVLGLLIASAKSSYDRRSNDLTQISVKLILLGRVMAHYGPETTDARDLLRRSVVRALDQMPPEHRVRPVLSGPTAGSEALDDKIHALSPQHDEQRSRKSHALQLNTDLTQTQLVAGRAEAASSIATPFLVLLTFWVTVHLHQLWPLCTPNATVIATLFVCARSVSGAICPDPGDGPAVCGADSESPAIHCAMLWRISGNNPVRVRREACTD